MGITGIPSTSLNNRTMATPSISEIPEKKKAEEAESDIARKKIMGSFHGKIMGKNIGELIQMAEEVAHIDVMRAEEKEQKIQENVQKLEKIKTFSQSLANICDAMNGSSVGYNKKPGAFSNSQAFLVSGQEGLIQAVVSDNVQPDEIAITINQFARKDSVVSTVPLNSTTEALGWSGDLIINDPATGKNQTISLSNAMNMKDIQSAINNVSGITGVVADIVIADNGNYFTFRSQNFARPIVIDSSSVTDSNNNNVTQLPPSSTKSVDDLSAKVIFRNSNQVKTYASNTIADQVSGATFSLLENHEVTYPATVVVGIKYNEDIPTTILEGTENAKGFLEVWNETIDLFQSSERYGGSITTHVSDLMRDTIDSIVTGIPTGNLRTLSELGITLGENGKLSLDTKIWKRNLETRFEEVRDALGFKWTTDNTDFTLSKRPDLVGNAITGKNLSFTISRDDNGALSANVIVKNNKGEITLSASMDIGKTVGNAVEIKGQKNSAFENVSLVFSGLGNLTPGNSRTANITMTQGIMDTLAGGLKEMLKTNAMFDNEFHMLTEKSEEQKKRIETVREMSERSVKKQVNQFMRLEAVYKSLEHALGFVKTLGAMQYAAAAA